MRILSISHIDRGGGAALSALNLHRRYLARGHESRLAVGERHTCEPTVLEIPNRAARSAWARWWEDRHMLLQPLVGRVRGAGRASLAWQEATFAIGEPGRYLRVLRGHEDFDYPGTWRLLDLVPRPEVIHCHNLHGSYFDLRALPWLSSHAPVVLDMRDLWLVTGHCAHPLDCDRWLTGCVSCADLSSYPAIRRDATAFNWHRKKDVYARSRLYVAAPSEWVLDRARRSMLGAADYRLVPNGIDLETFRPGDRTEARRQLGLPEDALVVGFVAHNQYKDVGTMEAALAQLDGRGRELLFLSLGHARGATRPLGGGQLREVPFVYDQPTLALYHRSFDAYLQAVTAEAFGKSVAEALACGTPVVATSVGGIPEVVRDGETGYLVPRADPVVAAARLQELLDDEELRCRLGTTAAADAATRFGLERQADDFLAWYAEVIEDWRAWRERC